jgi:putative transposase
VTDEAIAAMALRIGTRAACRAVGVAQASWYRRHRASPALPRPAAVPHRERVQPRALAAAERQAILDVLHSPRFADTAPAEAWATLLDEGIYLGSVSTFYRVLREAGESGARRPPIPPRSSPSSPPPARTRSTHGTSPGCTARRNGPTTTCT